MNLPPTRCLDRFTSADFDFLAEVFLGKRDDRAFRQLLTDEEVLSDLLESGRVYRALLELPAPLSVSADLYFDVLVRRALREAGIEDRRLAECVAATLAAQAYETRRCSVDEEMDYHIDVLQALDRATPYDRFFLHIQAANRFLFLTGLFPEFIRKRRDRRGAPGVRYYESVARDAYTQAGRHPLAGEFSLADLYLDLAEVLGETRTALNGLADRVLFLQS